MDADLTESEAIEQYALLVGRRDAALEKRDQYARRAQGYERMIEGLEILYPAVKDKQGRRINFADVADQPHDEREAEQAAAAIEDSLAPEDRSPGTYTAMMIVLQESTPNQWHKVSDIVHMIHQRGWVLNSEDPESLIRTALSKARRAGEVEETRFDGRTKGYRAKRGTDTETPAATGVSGTAPTTGHEGGEADHVQALASDHHHDPHRRNGHRVGPPVVA